MLYEFINFLIDSVAGAIDWVLGLFPRSPFQNMNSSKPEIINLGHITWFIPFSTMILHFSVLATAIGAYYTYRIVARWLKVVRS